MDRRNFLGVLLGGLSMYIASRLPWNNYGAVFKVIHVDPEGSGMDWSGHLGSYVYNAKRCCKNCTVIFAAFSPGGDVDNGPGFIGGELEPVNPAASRILADIRTTQGLRRSESSSFALAS
jgi:hypothetical protein